MLSGSGTGQNLLGIYNTSGIQTQAKGADTIPDAIRKAITKARTVGHARSSDLPRTRMESIRAPVNNPSVMAIGIRAIAASATIDSSY